MTGKILHYDTFSKKGRLSVEGDTYQLNLVFNSLNLDESYMQPMEGDCVAFGIHARTFPNSIDSLSWFFTSYIQLLSRAEPTPLANNT